MQYGGDELARDQSDRNDLTGHRIQMAERLGPIPRDQVARLVALDKLASSATSSAEAERPSSHTASSTEVSSRGWMQQDCTSRQKDSASPTSHPLILAIAINDVLIGSAPAMPSPNSPRRHQPRLALNQA